MSNPLSTSDAPSVLDKKVSKLYIKDGKRLLPTSDGVMSLSSDRSKKMFGKMKGGKYSKLQTN